MQPTWLTQSPFPLQRHRNVPGRGQAGHGAPSRLPVDTELQQVAGGRPAQGTWTQDKDTDTAEEGIWGSTGSPRAYWSAFQSLRFHLLNSGPCCVFVDKLNRC